MHKSLLEILYFPGVHRSTLPRRSQQDVWNQTYRNAQVRILFFWNITIANREEYVPDVVLTAQIYSWVSFFFSQFFAYQYALINPWTCPTLQSFQQTAHCDGNMPHQKILSIAMRWKIHVNALKDQRRWAAKTSFAAKTGWKCSVRARCTHCTEQL